MRQNNKLAVVILLLKDNKVLAVSRKNDPNAFGLPGGKVDPGEYLEEAAARELLEETGLVASNLKPVFVHNEDEYSTTTFTCDVTGEIITNESGIVKWVDPEVIFNGPFGKYNVQLFEHLNIYTSKIVKNTTVTTLPSGVKETVITLPPKAEQALQITVKIPSAYKSNY
jgi:8-oxo-dGTP pyrophosphatase MutT (NUDIX family)